MSGQPYKTPLDISKAREAYLANLKLRAELDDLNLQANKVYTKTGQLPVVPPDTRTVTEKLLDVERLKIEVRSKLLDVTDGIEANKIVDSLSPSNLVFLSQNFAPIRDQIKANYANGVLAIPFMDYLNRYIDKFEQTRGVEFGLQQATGSELLANQRLILAQMPSKADIGRIEDLVNVVGKVNVKIGQKIIENMNEIKDIIDTIPSVFSEISKTDNAILKSQMIQTLNNIVDEMPTKEEITRCLILLDRARQAKDQQNIELVLAKLNEISTVGIDIAEEMTILRQMRKGNKPLETGDEWEQAPSGFEAVLQSTEFQQGQIAPLGGQLELKSSLDPTFNQGTSTGDINKSRTAMQGYITKILPNVKSIRQDITGIGKLINILLGSNKKSITTLSETELRTLVKEMNTILINNGNAVPVGGAGMRGRGIAVRVRPSQVLDFDVDHSQGIKQSAKFVPIGRYLINKRQLDRDIIAIKRNAGSTIPNLPSQRVSRNLGSVMRKIIGGALPSFDELNNLDDDEKVYLHKVARETRIDDKLSIPTPKKDEDEKDINQFEILKGQILAGNDNPELVKKFKTILLKLSRKDLIPKIQVKELLLDLATLGH